MSNRKTERNICDLNRGERTLLPEVVFARPKDDKTLLDAVGQLLRGNGKALVTKCSKRQIALLKKNFGSKARKYDEISGTAIISLAPIMDNKRSKGKPGGSIAVVAAGSSDYFVAEEAALTLEFLGVSVSRYYDCGVAGIHRVVVPVQEINSNRVDAVIVVAGMEGALPSIVAGLVKQPVIAVPTSVGYGTSFNGVTALLSMLNACSPGVTVVNIDNGFGAAAYAFKMVRWLKGGR